MPEKTIVQKRLLLEQLIQTERQKGLLNSGSVFCVLRLEIKFPTPLGIVFKIFFRSGWVSKNLT